MRSVQVASFASTNECAARSRSVVAAAFMITSKIACGTRMVDGQRRVLTQARYLRDTAVGTDNAP